MRATEAPVMSDEPGHVGLHLPALDKRGLGGRMVEMKPGEGRTF